MFVVFCQEIRLQFHHLVDHFQALSFKGWVDLRDVIIAKAGATAAIFIHMYVFMGSMIGEFKKLHPKNDNLKTPPK